MSHIWRRLLCVFVFAFACASPAIAERELHVVAVGKGWLASGDFTNPPRAKVWVDRPGVSVVLVLLDRGAVEWQIEASDQSVIETIILGGQEAAPLATGVIPKSSILFHDLPLPMDKNTDLPFIDGFLGGPYRNLLNRLFQETDVRGAGSVQVRRQAPEGAISVSTLNQSSRRPVGYLEPLVGQTTDLPGRLQAYLANPSHSDAPKATFTPTGMRFETGEGTKIFPLPEDVERPFLPNGAYYDAETNAIFGVTFGGPGWLYRVDVESGEWDVVENLRGYDAAGILRDSDNDLFVLTGARSRPGEIALLRLGESIETVLFEVRALPGFTDLYAYPNAFPPRLTPRVYEDQWLIAEATSKLDEGITGYGKHRLYALNLATREVRLLAFTNFE